MTNPRGPTILQQLQAAFKAKGWSVDELRLASGMRIERTTLGKKMRGVIPLRDREIQQLAVCLGVTIIWPSRARRAQRAAA